MVNKENFMKNKIKLALETYNKYAELYAKYTKDKLLQFQLTEFSSMLPKKGKVLDAGCGCGRDAAYLSEEGLNVTAVDICDGMINEAKKNNVLVKKQDILKLKEQDEYDGVWCMATLADIPKTDVSKVLKNFFTSLKKEGILYIAVKEGKGEELIEKEKYGNLPRFYAFYEKEELEKLLIDSGFIVHKSTLSNDRGIKWVEIFAKKS